MGTKEKRMWMVEITNMSNLVRWKFVKSLLLLIMTSRKIKKVKGSQLSYLQFHPICGLHFVKPAANWNLKI